MAEKQTELQKLVAIANDRELASRLREQAIEMIGILGSHEALLALLGLAANETLVKKERELSLKYAREIIRISS